MDIEQFKRVVTAFADDPADVDVGKGKLLVQVRDEVIDATLSLADGELMVEEEEGERLTARSWIVKRVARLPLLADRICSHVPSPKHFVAPDGHLLLDIGDGGAESPEPSAVVAASRMLQQTPGTTNVCYLTADAGEGKTCLINYLSVKQAQAYKRKEQSWLLVPVPLGGRTFLRFDDVVVATLVNRLRFQLLYYDAFLELIRIGAVVPAFDGFEEMIVEGASGDEAISALGYLISNLGSAGTVLVAARKAYFEYLSFASQARLFAAIDKGDVVFNRLSLTRWNRTHFVHYAKKRGVDDPDRLFEEVARRLAREDHPLLSRAVLVRRLVDVASETSAGLSGVLDRMGQRPQDYFHDFVTAIVEREARDKWVDKSGDPPGPLLTIEEHHELLAMVAQEMWLNSTDALRQDNVGFVAELFAENNGKQPAVARQIQERLKQHALLIASQDGRSLEFDHDDFRLFYLGEALGQGLVRRDEEAVKSVLRTASLPRGAVDQAAIHAHRHRDSGRGVQGTIGLLQAIARPERPTSFVRENCGALTAAVVDCGVGGGAAGSCDVGSLSFPTDAMSRRSWQGLTVTDSHFAPTSLSGTCLTDCRFVRCQFNRLDGRPDTVHQTILEACRIDGVVYQGEDDDVIELYSPEQIRRNLGDHGFSFEDQGETSLNQASAASRTEPSEALKLTQRSLRAFLQSTNVKGATLARKLGASAKRFEKDILPQLLRSNVLQEVPYRGRGQDRAFRLAVPVARIDTALRSCSGDFDRFMRAFEDQLAPNRSADR